MISVSTLAHLERRAWVFIVMTIVNRIVQTLLRCFMSFVNEHPAGALRQPQYILHASLNFHPKRTPQYQGDTVSDAPSHGPDLEHKLSRVLAPAAQPGWHYVRMGKAMSLGWLFRHGGERYTASSLWEYWFSLDVVACKQFHRGGQGAKRRVARDTYSRGGGCGRCLVVVMVVVRVYAL